MNPRRGPTILNCSVPKQLQARQRKRQRNVPNSESAKKRLRQSRRRRVRNRSVRSEIRTRTRTLLSMDAPQQAEPALAELYRLLDQAAQHHIIPANAAARQKARAARHVRSLTES